MEKDAACHWSLRRPVITEVLTWFLIPSGGMLDFVSSSALFPFPTLWNVYNCCRWSRTPKSHHDIPPSWAIPQNNFLSLQERAQSYAACLLRLIPAILRQRHNQLPLGGIFICISPLLQKQLVATLHFFTDGSKCSRATVAINPSLKIYF